jgi:hypothetical protein
MRQLSKYITALHSTYNFHDSAANSIETIFWKLASESLYQLLTACT